MPPKVRNPSITMNFRGDRVKTWDVIIVGAGVIGLSLAIELRKTGRTVLLVERGEPGREASHAAGGMLANYGDEISDALKLLADASAQMYPEFVHELQDESGLHIDLRSDGTILFPAHSLILQRPDSGAETLIPARLKDLEPALASLNRPAIYLKERSVDPRDLLAACVKAARHRGVDISSGDPVSVINLSDGHATGVSTSRTTFLSETVLNCSGAWAGQLGPIPLPIRPVKGQMLAVAMPSKNLLRHVVRSPEVYLIPRSDGRLVIGATLEEAGFNKQTVPETIKQLHQAALALLPDLQNARMLEAWAGLRPATPDDLPILGRTEVPGYFVATGHHRDGILLAPITAKLVAQVVCGAKPEYDLERFSAGRFNSKAA
jgi:glycine oxidase